MAGGITNYSDGDVDLLSGLFAANHSTGFFICQLDFPLEIPQNPGDFEIDQLLTNMHVTHANPAFASQYGAKVQDVIGLTPAVFFRKNPEEGRDTMRELLINNQLSRITREYRLDGEDVFIKGEYYALLDPQNRIKGYFGIQHDVSTEVKDERLIKEQIHLKSITEEITQTASFEWVVGSQLGEFSKGVYSILGIEQDAKLNKDLFFNLIASSDLKKAKALFKKLAAGKLKDSFVLEIGIKRRDGNRRNLWSKMTPVFDEDGNFVKIFGAIQDITERSRKELLTDVIYKISEAAIELSDFKEFYKTIQLEIGRLVDANNMFVAFYKAATDELDVQYVTGESKRFKCLPAAGTISKLVITENCSLLLDNDTLLDLDKRGKIKRIGKSSKTWLGVPLREGNEPFGVLVVQNYERTNALNEEDQALLEFISIQLVSAIRRMNDGEQIEILRNSIQQSPVSVVITDKKGDIEYVNPKFEEVTGYSFVESLGQNPRMLKSGNQPESVYKELWDTITKGEEWRGEFQNKKKDGTLYWELASISPIKNPKDEITHFVAVKEDITTRKRMEKDLILAKDKAEESDRLKTAFLANMSHEVRTPMNGILGFAELLKENELSKEDFDRYIEIINSNGHQLLGIIEDIITVSNLEVKQLKLNLSEFDLIGFLDNIRMTIEMERKFLSKEHIDLVFHPLNSPIKWIKTDHGKLQQVLINLLKNALKFTERGQIQLKMTEDSPGFGTFQVTDSGIGIPDSMLGIIFDRFRQVDDSNTRSFGGTGLGLAISRGLVELMGGEIWVKSTLNQGSVFTFTIPLN